MTRALAWIAVVVALFVCVRAIAVEREQADGYPHHLSGRAAQVAARAIDQGEQAQAQAQNALNLVSQPATEANPPGSPSAMDAGACAAVPTQAGC